MKNKKVSAFTIMELTVAMLISAMVIAVAYTAFVLMGNVYRNYHTRQTELAVLMRVDELLRRDFTRAEFITYRNDSLCFWVDSQQVRYAFSGDKIIRKSGIIDTFKVEGKLPVYLFEGSVLELRPDTLRVDEMYFDINYMKNSFPYHYKKQFSSAELFK